MTVLTADTIGNSFINCIEFLWNREDWDRRHAWAGPRGYVIACDEAIASIRAFEARGHQFEPPSEDEWEEFYKRNANYPFEQSG